VPFTPNPATQITIRGLIEVLPSFLADDRFDRFTAMICQAAVGEGHLDVRVLQSQIIYVCDHDD
jgi:hypothetical protein